ncbi:hypothetical protein [Streptomyces tubercidicus]
MELRDGDPGRRQGKGVDGRIHDGAFSARTRFWRSVGYWSVDTRL